MNISFLYIFLEIKCVWQRDKFEWTARLPWIDATNEATRTRWWIIIADWPRKMNEWTEIQTAIQRKWKKRSAPRDVDGATDFGGRASWKQKSALAIPPRFFLSLSLSSFAIGCCLKNKKYLKNLFWRRSTASERGWLLFWRLPHVDAAPPSAGALHLFVRPFDERGTHDDDGRGGAAAHRSLPSLASIHPKSCQVNSHPHSFFVFMRESVSVWPLLLKKKKKKIGKGIREGQVIRGVDIRTFWKMEKNKIRNKTKVETTPPPPLDLPYRKR